MSGTATIDPEPPRAQPAPPPAGASKSLRWFELALVLLIAFGGYFLTSLHTLLAGHVTTSPENSSWMTALLRELTALALLWYVLARRNLRFGNLGLRWSLRDLSSGLGVTVLSWITYGVARLFVHAVFHAIFPATHAGLSASQVFGHPSLMAIPLFLLNPFFEELTVRAYLMTEVKDLTGSWIPAAILSVALQSSYHLYYGWETAISLSFQFLVFSIYYARTRRATPIIFAHAFFDIYGLVRLSL